MLLKSHEHLPEEGGGATTASRSLTGTVKAP
jgi:hypothetical protein